MQGHGATSATGTRGATSGWLARRARLRAAIRRGPLALLTAVLLALPVGTLTVLPSSPAQAAAPTNDLTLGVASARTEPRAFGGDGVTKGDPVENFKFIINEDDTGGTGLKTATGPCSTATAGYPADCPWTSLNAAPDAARIVAQGDQDALAGGLNLPDGQYLISVLADGYKLDGAHFTMPLPDETPLAVELQPMPLPDSTVRGQVFEDMAPTNGAFDAGDLPLQGFVGHIERHPRRGQHRRVRQPALHHVRGRGPRHPRDPARRARRRHGSRGRPGTAAGASATPTAS